MTLLPLPNLTAQRPGGRWIEPTEKQDDEFNKLLSVPKLWQESVAREKAKDYAGALAKLKEYQDAGGDEFMVQMRAGRLRALQGDLEASASAFERAGRINGKSVNARLGYMNIQIARNDANRMVNAAQRMLQAEPFNYQAHLIIATAYFTKKDYKTAATKFSHLLDRHPMDVDALAYAAASRLRAGDKAGAVAVAGKFATLLPDYENSGPLGAEICGALLDQLKKGAAARELWNKSVEAEEAGDLGEALGHAEAYVKAGGDRYFGSMRAAWLLRSGKQHEKALKFYQHAGSLKNFALNPRIGTLAMLVELKDSEAIPAAQREMLRVKPNDYQTMVAMGDEPFSEKKYRTTESQFRRIHELYPLDATALSYLAWSAYYNNHKRTAAEAFVKLLSIDPGYEDAEKGLSYSIDRPYRDFGPAANR